MSDSVRLMVGPEQSDNAHFGVLMRLLRDEAGLSRVQAAETVSLSTEFLRLIERGRRVPAAGTMRGILEEYRVPFEVHSENDHYVFEFHGHRVEFISRIQESRKAKLAYFADTQRNERIGRIVGLLTMADDKTLNQIHTVLLKSTR